MASLGVGEIAALAASVIGTGLNVKASNDATNQKIGMLRRAGDTAKEITDQSIASANQGAQKYAPDERATTQEQTEKSIEQSLGNALVKAQNQPTEETTGRVSDEYLASKGKAATERTARGVKLAQMMARLRSPGELRFSEGMDNANTVNKIGALTGDARNVLNAGQIDAEGVSPNSGMQFTGDAIRLGGNAYASAERENRLRRSGIYGQQGDTYGKKP